MLKIQRCVAGESVVLALSGRIRAWHVAELRALIDAEEHVELDLKEVNLVDREVVRFLRCCEAESVGIRNCPAYVREWILRERAGD